MKKTIGAGVAALSLFVGSASAAVTAQDLMREFGLITLEDATVGGGTHTDGNAFIGGDLHSPSGFEVNQHRYDPVGNPFNASLVVGGEINGTVKVFGGDALLGNPLPAGSGLTFQDAGTGSVAGTVDVASVANSLLTFSNSLSLLESTGGSFIAQGGQNGKFTPSYGSGNVAVFNLDVSDFAVLTDIQFYDPSGTVVVNVSGETFDTGQLGSVNPNVIFNLYDATTVVIDAAFGASILAPKAYMMQTSNVRGSVVVRSLISTTELNGSYYSGDVPEVPLPAGVWLMGVGVAALAVARRRRQPARRG